MHAIAERRLTKLFAPYELDFQHNINLPSCFAVLKELRASDSAEVLKTWLNGWVTSYSMHEDVLLNCLFGCHRQPDSLHHYVQCPHMFALLKFLKHDCSPEPLTRLGLINPNGCCMKVVCCMFSAYHAVKAKVRAGQITDISAINGNTFSSAGPALRFAWSVFAQTFAAEAGEFAIQCRAFSLPKFIAFLTSGGIHPADGTRAVVQNSFSFLSTNQIH